MTVNTDLFEGTYGKKPRGFGSWAFEVSTYEKGHRVTVTERAHGTYSEALGAVKRRLIAAGKRNDVQIRVLP